MDDAIESCAKEIADNWTQGYIGDLPAIIRRHLGDGEGKLTKIEAICRRHCSPAVVTSTHILALNVLKIIEGKG